MESLSKHSPVTLHLSPATRILNENPASYIENTLWCSDVYNLALKLDNSLQIVKITGHSLRRKGKCNPLARVTLAPGLPSLLVNRTLV